jgi:Na+-translocating membrane potential-generating system (MpsC)
MDPLAASTSSEPTYQRQSVLSEISREMVRLYKEQFGRGPSRVRTNFAGPKVDVCVEVFHLEPKAAGGVEPGGGT